MRSKKKSSAPPASATPAAPSVNTPLLGVVYVQRRGSRRFWYGQQYRPDGAPTGGPLEILPIEAGVVAADLADEVARTWATTIGAPLACVEVKTEEVDED